MNTDLTEAEKAELLALGSDVAEALHSPWQPRTISRAFASRGLGQITFTLQHWIDLDAVRSPLLDGRACESEIELHTTLAVFGLVVEEATEIALIWETLQIEVDESFAASLPMQPEEAEESESEDGFGDWAPLLACLIAQLGMPRSEATSTPVAQAFILIAAHRRNQGWRPSGTLYALREV